MSKKIPFNRPYATGNEFDYIKQAIDRAHLSGNGWFTKQCQKWLEEVIGCPKTFLTHSGTAALEMAAILINAEAGDEIIMPSFTFVSTANAFAMRGATPVFVDVRPDSLNINEQLIEEAITARTKAIVPVHYAGVSCEMDSIMEIAKRRGLTVVEDAAHALLSRYKDRSVGGSGQLSVLSFHETKNIQAGQAGALLINDASYIDRAWTIWEKGTNRREFFLGQTDKYTWNDIGSSFLPSEITAAFLLAQMEKAQEITASRRKIWQHYHYLFEELEKEGLVRRPIHPPHCSLNGHIYYLLVQTREIRTALLRFLNDAGINAVFHYVPLHQSPAGMRFGRSCGSLTNTEDLSGRLVRLPLWVGLTNEDVEMICEQVKRFFQS